MRVLPESFVIEKYGLKVRLVNLDDAEFIVSLRADPEKTKAMVTLEPNVEKQRQWIAEYKKREREGLDYYFIYINKENIKIGINRISQINYEKKECKTSSWIAINGLDYEPLKMALIRNEITFNVLGINCCWGDVHKENKKVIKVLGLFGGRFFDKSEDFYQIIITKEGFFEACKSSKIKKLKTL